MRLPLALLFMAPHLALGYGAQITVDEPGVGNSVLLLEKVPNLKRWINREDPTINISSEIPVTIFRYNDNQYLEGGQPVAEDEVYLVVKSNCSKNDFVPKIKYQNYTIDKEQFTGSISISVAPDASSNQELDDTSFLEPSAFLAKWSYTSFGCKKAAESETSSSASPIFSTTFGPTSSTSFGPTSAPRSSSSYIHWNSPCLLPTLLTGVLAIVSFFSDVAAFGSRSVFFLVVIMIGTTLLGMTSAQNMARKEVTGIKFDYTDSSHRHLASTCALSAEILIDGCRRHWADGVADLGVEAPNVRVLDVSIKDETSSRDAKDKCVNRYEAILMFPETPVTFQNQSGDSFPVPKLPLDKCGRPVEGRPFVDSSGKQLQASATVSETPQWSASAGIQIEYDSGVQSSSAYENLGKEWSKRALGEHASVPAFSAFVIALMTNQAPPALIEDALVAAMDEVSHAKTSFNIASALLKTTVEPGPLPPTSHNFKYDLRALVTAAAQEGCIDETLSALVAAFEVDDDLDRHYGEIDDQTMSAIKSRLRTIALEESTHSALAWRTIQWACKVDPTACTGLESSVFSAVHLRRAFFDRLGGRAQTNNNHGTFEAAWEKIHKTLIPAALNKKSSLSLEQEEECDTLTSSEGLGLVDVLSGKVIQGVLCPAVPLPVRVEM
eukprot:CAMPEP_0113595856 /NCGR_PEP_ID=MMETSP0015_2-20120614/39992_1 /TAXON_ID=2838 /ORGANISM="Odontella" /LENGTH=665 /DNA_ID=CAMNT_0000503265 /DNA_START=417 /DNA_END=2414 /DNA_ORIENTATION=- /assembly_acc=CAM_ASM_000160